MKVLSVFILLLSCGTQVEVKGPSNEELLKKYIGTCLQDAEKAKWEENGDRIYKIVDYDERTNKFLLVQDGKNQTYQIIEYYRFKKEVYICSYINMYEYYCWLAKQISCEEYKG